MDDNNENNNNDENKNNFDNENENIDNNEDINNNEEEMPQTHWKSAAEVDDDYVNESDDEEGIYLFIYLDNEDDEALPIFANRENRELQSEVEKKEAKLEAILNTVAEHQERVAVIKEHLKNVQNEIENTQLLYNAKSKEMNTESHLRQIGKREIGRINQELTKIKRELEDIQDRSNVIQNNIFQGNNKMDAFRAEMNMNQEELEEWALAAKQKEEDHQALERYEHIDDSKVHNLLIEVEKVTTSVQEAKEILEAAITETESKQIELDKTAQEFRRMHKERQTLIEQCSVVSDAMKRRDDDINKASEEYADLIKKTNEQKEVVKQQEDVLKRNKKDNSELELQIAAKERTLEKNRVDIKSLEEKLNEFKDQVAVTHNELSKTASELAFQKVKIKNYVLFI